MKVCFWADTLKLVLRGMHAMQQCNVELNKKVKLTTTTTTTNNNNNKHHRHQRKQQGDKPFQACSVLMDAGLSEYELI
jgi:hypothetical protein